VNWLALSIRLSFRYRLSLFAVIIRFFCLRNDYFQSHSFCLIIQSSQLVFHVTQRVQVTDFGINSNGPPCLLSEVSDFDGFSSSSLAWQTFMGHPSLDFLTTGFVWRRATLNPNMEGQTSVFVTPRDRVTQLYLQALGTHFSRLLRHTWAALGLFLSSGHHMETDGF
jgi:hypothetical protein